FNASIAQWLNNLSPVGVWIFTGAGRLGRAHRWHAGRVGRIGLRHLFSGTPQRGRARRASFLFLGNGWRTQIHFLFDAHDFLAIHLHGLDAHDFVANEAHKIYILRGRAVDPFFVLNFVGGLAHFLWRTSLGVDHHVVIHSHQHVVIFDGLFSLGRNGFQVGLERRLG